MSTQPTVPSLNLEESAKDATVTLESKKSFGKKIAGSFKKIMSTPRTASTGSIDGLNKTSSNTSNIIPNATATVNKTVSPIIAAADDAVSATTAAVKTETTRLGKEAEAAKVKVTTAVEKTKKNEGAKKTIGIIVAISAVIAGVIAASHGKKEEVAAPPPPPKKKGFW